MISMRRVSEGIEKLHFTESRLSSPLTEGRTLSIPVYGVLPMAGHPLMADGPRLPSGKLVFRGVVTSKRSLTEYTEIPKSRTALRMNI